MDETYVGGKRENVPKHKREELTGRESVGKAVVVEIRDRDSIRVDPAPMPGVNQESASEMVGREVSSEATVLYWREQQIEPAGRS